MQKNFFAELFDFSFSEFITPKLVKVLYILAIIGIALYAAFGLYSAFAYSDGFASTLLALVLVPIGALVMLILARFYMELLLVIFRIADNVDKIAKKSGVNE